jgi:hypothetical protein
MVQAAVGVAEIEAKLLEIIDDHFSPYTRDQTTRGWWCPGWDY